MRNNTNVRTTRLALCLLIGFGFTFGQSPIPLDYKPEDLVKLDQQWNFHTEDYPKYLRSAAEDALVSMLRKAKIEGIHLRVFSAFRSSERQKSLYENAVERYGPDQKWVARPGYSEHQLGTAVDLCGLDPDSVASPEFGHSREGKWLKENAEQFGFSQSYTEENAETTGYRPEPWHYRFREPEIQKAPGR